MKKLIVLILVICLVWLTRGVVFGQGKILVSVSNNNTFTDDSLYIMNPDGSGQRKLFDFHRHPKHNSGRILFPRVSRDGRYIYFSSDNSFAYTPAGRNLFRIPVNGSRWEQITPGPHSGKWNMPCPCGMVVGTVRRPNGTAWGNCPIYLEGMSMIFSRPDGTFRFDRVPEGRRWIVAYRPGSTVFDSQLIVVTRGATARVDFVPRSDFRWSFERPAFYGNRIYYQSGVKDIQWTDVGGTNHTKVYSSTGACTGITDVDGFDVAPSSGRLAIMDYQEGCMTNRGLYIADGNGGNMRLLLDLKQNNNACGAGEVFWSPDESKLAFKVCYNWQTCFFVISAYNGNVLGYICAPNRSYTVHNTFLCGWSPDGQWLLYYMYLNNPAAGMMFKVKVTAQGAIDHNSGVGLLNNVAISGATWANL